MHSPVSLVVPGGLERLEGGGGGTTNATVVLRCSPLAAADICFASCCCTARCDRQLAALHCPAGLQGPADARCVALPLTAALSSTPFAAVFCQRQYKGGCGVAEEEGPREAAAQPS